MSEIFIRDINSKGQGVGSLKGLTLFVDYALIQELVEVEIYKEKPSYAQATLKKIIKENPERIDPICPHFFRCGGCQIMHAEYALQLKIKHKKVQNALKKIGEVNALVEEVEPCENPLNYRNKTQMPYSFHGLGLYAKQSHDVVKIDQCYLHMPLNEQIFQQVKVLLEKCDISPFNEKTGEGELKHVLMRASGFENKVLLTFICAVKPSQKLLKLCEKLYKNNSQIKGIIHHLNERRDNRIFGSSYCVLFGEDSLTEKLSEHLFNLSHLSFFQVNPKVAEKLYEYALTIAQVKSSDVVIDAFCGVGTLSIYFAKKAKTVIGIETIQQATEDAKQNAKLNHFTNLQFLCGRFEKTCKELVQADIVLLNPPRKGVEKFALDAVINLKPRSIIYISCDPASLARDIKYLCAHHFQIVCIKPFDMFPQTMHVETVVRLDFCI